AIEDSKFVLACLSELSINKRGYLQKKLKKALDVADEQPEGGVFLIPVRLEDCQVPQRLQRWQWVDLFQDDGYYKLLRVLRGEI
ncbi:MAG: toll/interleukin-1 receptor domain-containing protein, partial [Micromonosporaceae bacterium]